MFSLILCVLLSAPVEVNLDDFGLSSLTVMSDQEGLDIRGKGFYSFYGRNVSGSLSEGFSYRAGGSSYSSFGSARGSVWTSGFSELQ